MQQGCTVDSRIKVALRLSILKLESLSDFSKNECNTAIQWENE